MNSFPAAYIIADDEEKCGLFDLFSVCKCVMVLKYSRVWRFF